MAIMLCIADGPRKYYVNRLRMIVKSVSSQEFCVDMNFSPYAAKTAAQFVVYRCTLQLFVSWNGY